MVLESVGGEVEFLAPGVVWKVSEGKG